MNPKAILNKYKRLPVMTKAALWFLVCDFISKGITLFTTPVFSRLLSTAEYGVFSVYSAWYSVIIILASLNLASGVYMQGLVKFDDDRDAFTSSMEYLFLTITLCWFIIYLPFQSFWSRLLNLDRAYLTVMFADIVANTSFHFWATRQRVEYRYRGLILFTILNAIFKPLSGIAAILLFPKAALSARIFTLVAADVIVFSPFILEIFTKYRKCFNTRYWKYALAFNLPLVAHYLSQIVLNQSDRIMIRSMIGDSEAGIYSLGYTIASILLVANTALLNTASPWIYQCMKDRHFRRIGQLMTPLILLVGVSNFLLILLAPELLQIFAPSSYTQAAYIIPPVAASTFFIFMYTLFSRFEFYYEKTRYMMIASVSGALLNLLLNYIFIQKYGFLAAGYTTLVCYILYCCFHYFFMKRICRQENIREQVYSGKWILGISAVFSVICISMVFIYPYTWVRWGLFLILCFVLFLYRKKLMQVISQIMSAKKKKKNQEKI